MRREAKFLAGAAVGGALGALALFALMAAALHLG